jgi:hypothetical protein
MIVERQITCTLNVHVSTINTINSQRQTYENKMYMRAVCWTRYTYKESMSRTEVKLTLVNYNTEHTKDSPPLGLNLTLLNTNPILST